MMEAEKASETSDYKTGRPTDFIALSGRESFESGKKSFNKG
jgi:hypothetical protein